MLPPRWVRRVVLAPAVVALGVLLLTAAPLVLLVALALSPLVPGRWRPLRFAWLAVLQLAGEAVLLVVLFLLWVGSGFGVAIRRPWFERAHYRLVALYLRLMFAEARRVLGVRVEVTGPAPQAYSGRPLLVFCRHAGPGDSFLLTHALVNWYDREPRIVLKDTMQWDPVVDVVLNRLPSRFVSPRPPGGSAGPRDGLAAQVGRLAAGLDDDDAFVIFPEGGNFAERRRAAGIARLRERGQAVQADLAEQMRHVLPPRPGGVLAALANAPDADVVWVAHTGTDHIFTVADLWREMPMDTTIEMRWWQVPAGEVPPDDEGRREWLWQWWGRIDAWIAERRAAADR